MIGSKVFNQMVSAAEPPFPHPRAILHIARERLFLGVHSRLVSLEISLSGK